MVLGCQGANVVLRYIELLYEAGATTNARSADVSRGITAEFLAGVAGIVLGILALLRIVPMTLMSAAVVTYGGTPLLTSSESVWLTPLGKENEVVQQLMHSTGVAAAGAQVLVGLVALVAWHFGTCGHPANNDDPGCLARDRSVNAVTQFGRGWILARLPAHVIPTANREPRATSSLLAALICNRSHSRIETTSYSDIMRNAEGAEPQQQLDPRRK